MILSIELQYVTESGNVEGVVHFFRAQHADVCRIAFKLYFFNEEGGISKFRDRVFFPDEYVDFSGYFETSDKFQEYMFVFESSNDTVRFVTQRNMVLFEETGDSQVNTDS